MQTSPITTTAPPTPNLKSEICDVKFGAPDSTDPCAESPNLKSEIGNLECRAAALPSPMFPDRIVGHDLSKQPPVREPANLKSQISNLKSPSAPEPPFNPEPKTASPPSPLPPFAPVESVPPLANPQFLQALSALQQLPGESRQCHEIFQLFAR